MQSSVRIVVADDEPDMQEYFEKILPRLGHQVVGIATNGKELVQLCQELKPDLVLTDIRMPEMDGIDAAIEIYRERPTPIILISAYHNDELIKRAEADHIICYLVKPIKQSDLQPAIAIALRRFHEMQALQQESPDPREAQQAHRTVEKAKEVLMRRGIHDEILAFDRLQQVARARDLKVVEVAEMIIISEEVLKGAQESTDRS